MKTFCIDTPAYFQLIIWFMILHKLFYSFFSGLLWDLPTGPAGVLSVLLQQRKAEAPEARTEVGELADFRAWILRSNVQQALLDLRFT
jgi:hypothetical protein